MKDWKSLEERLRTYPFSSLPEYEGIKRIQNILIGAETLSFVGPEAGSAPLSEMLRDTADYYASLR